MNINTILHLYYNVYTQFDKVVFKVFSIIPEKKTYFKITVTKNRREKLQHNHFIKRT